jgi:hypothetical protein
MYFPGWFNILVDAMADGSTLKFLRIMTVTTGYGCFSLQLRKSGTQLSVHLYDDYNDVSVDSENINSATWYHFGIYYSSSADAWEWWLSTTDDLGASKGSASGDWSRAPGRIMIGYSTNTGTWGSGTTNIAWDSFDVDYSSLVHSAEDGAGATSVYPGRGIGRGVLRGIGR